MNRQDEPMPFFFVVMTLTIVMLSVTVSHAADITGNWRGTNLTDDRAILFCFGPSNDFYIEDEISWIQGVYSSKPDSVPGQLELFVQDGSNAQDVGKTFRYRYDMSDHFLTLYGTDPGNGDRPTTLAVANTAGNAIFIGVNTDPEDDEDDDDDDVKWNLYASCFVKGLADSLPAVFFPSSPPHHRHSASKTPWAVSVSEHCEGAHPY
jgi:hypothetical protein